MIAATLFSGIGAPETAMPLWRWAWSAEIEKFPAAVLAARHPHSVNLGDVTADDFIARARAIARPDVLVFGSPCQDWSVAGKRLGLDGTRGNLALTALRIVGELRPSWFVFENVPGLMSAWSGGPECPPEPGSGIEGVENSDFAAFLGTVDELGYSLCWARLDAQHFGVAQRRERVFAVGYLGDWRYPAAVLLEPKSLCGNPPTREQARQDVAGAIGAGSKRSGGRVGRREAAAGHIIAPPITSNPYSDHESREGLLISHALRAEGFDASEDGTGRGIPIIPICESGKRANVKDSPKNGMGIGEAGAPMFTLGTDSRHAIAFQCHGTNVGEMGTLRKGDGGVTSGVPFVAYGIGSDAVDRSGEGAAGNAAERSGLNVVEECQPSLRARPNNSVGMATGVRRLMPVECERLQGFPQVQSCIRICVWPSSDLQMNAALAEMQSRKSPLSALNVANGGSAQFVRRVDETLNANHLDHGLPVAAHVLIDLERQEVQLGSPGRSPWRVGIAARPVVSPLSMPLVDFVRLVAPMPPIAAQQIAHGAAGSQANTNGSSPHLNGSARRA